MGFFARLANLWRGFLSLFVKGIEENNPEAVYEAAIQARILKHQELKKAASAIVYLRNKIDKEEDDVEAQLNEIKLQIPVAVEEGQDDVALVLIQKQEELESKHARLTAELQKVDRQAEDAKASLVAFQAEIQKLKREKDEKLAEKATAEARIQIQEQLSGLSLDADIQALDGVREAISKKVAEADIGAEIGESSLDAKLAKLKQRTGSLSAKSKLDAMKAQMAAKAKASEAVAAGGGAAKNL